MDMFSGVSYAVLVLAIATLALGVAAVLVRVLSTRREARIDQRRAAMLQALKDYLGGTVERRAVLKLMRRDRKTALDMLVGIATELPTPERERLHVFFDHFQFEQKEYAVLHGDSWLKRARAASELGLAGEHTAAPELIAALNDETLDVRLAAAHSLAQLRAGGAVAPILQALTLKPEWPPQRAAEIFPEMGPVAIPGLLDFLRTQETSIRSRRSAERAVLVAVRALGLLRAGDATPTLIGLLDHPDSELRLMAARALGQIGDSAAVAPLMESLNDQAWEVRCMAAQALGRAMNVAAVPALARRLDDPAWWVRFNAAEALHRLGEPGCDALRAAVTPGAGGLAYDIARQTLEEHGRVAVEERT